MVEKQNVEWKESWRDEYIKWICGFANAQGGSIFIGVDDNGNVTGIDNSKRLLDEIPNKVRDILGILVDVDLHNDNGKNYIEIRTSASLYPVNYRGEYHYRSGSTKQILKGASLNQFLMQKTGLTWDRVPVPNVDLESFRNDAFDIFKEEALRSGRVSTLNLQLDNRQLLDHLNLLESGELTRAAVLLFHHNPEKWIPGAYIKIGFFDSESDIRFQDEERGPLISQALKIIDLIYQKYLKAEISYQEVTRVETYPFPIGAVREAVFNAIIHKDYSSLTPIHIRVYKDRMYVANDCILPSEWTIDDLLLEHKSKPHNPLIANAFFRAGLIESWGRGIEKIKASCLRHGIPIPEYTGHQTDIMVKFHTRKPPKKITQENHPRKPPKKITQENYQLKHIEQLILTLIMENPEITRHEIALILERSENSIKYYLGKLTSSGVLSREGSTKKGVWVINRPELYI